jgi:hypothetical protein
MRAQLARAESRLAYVRYVGANSEIEGEAHGLNAEAAELVQEIADLQARIKAATGEPPTSGARGRE